MTEPFSARILPLSDALHGLAHQVAQHDPDLGSQVILLAARVGLLQPAARDLERQLRAARCTVDELHADAAEDAALPPPHVVRHTPCPTAAAIAAMDARQRRARTIADILGPVLRHPTHPTRQR